MNLGIPGTVYNGTYLLPIIKKVTEGFNIREKGDGGI